MPLFKKVETHLIAVNDLDPAREAVERALANASSDERPGLQRALEIIDTVTVPGEPRLRWAKKVLDEAGVDVDTHRIQAVRTIRDSLPGLGLSAAVELVKDVQGAAQS